MILVDSNVPMYASGADHPNKAPALRFLRRVAEGSVEANIDAEMLREVIHRYTALGRWDEGRQVYATVVIVYGLQGICTFDRDVDRIP